jgi:hypothetical protein
VLDGAEQIDKGATEAIDGPSHHHAELAPAGIL